MAGRRLRGESSARQTAATPASRAPADDLGPVIGGVDPGTRQVGYAVLRLEAAGWRVLACGSIQCGRGEMAARLARVATELEALFGEHRPEQVGIETTYFGRSAGAAIKMGQGRGVAMAAAARSGAKVVELSPRSIKQAVTGFGGASKEQVAQMASKLLNLQRLPASRDASDALGCALAVALQLRLSALAGRGLYEAPAVRPGRPGGRLALAPIATANRAAATPGDRSASARRPGRKLRGGGIGGSEGRQSGV